MAVNLKNWGREYDKAKKIKNKSTDLLPKSTDVNLNFLFNGNFKEKQKQQKQNK